MSETSQQTIATDQTPLATRQQTSGWQQFTGHASRLAAWIVPVVILIIWQVASQNGLLQSRVLPAPFDVLKAFYALSQSGELWLHLKISTGRALAGLLIGGGLGLFFGLLNGTSKIASTLLDSTFQMLRHIPVLAIIPLVILWFGIDESAKLFLVAFGAFFPMYYNTYYGIREVDPQLIEMGKSYGLTRWQLYRDIIFPGALSSILVGLRFSLGFVWVILIVAETVSASSGIGYMTMNAREFLQTDVVLVGIILYALLGKLSDVLAKLLERALLRWHAGYQHR